MKSKTSAQKTLVGTIHPVVLDYTAGEDIRLDRALIEADVLGSIAHVNMLSRMPMRPPILTTSDAQAIRGVLGGILRDARNGSFSISLADQDVHLAVERRLTRELGDVGRKVHTARSRNDQVALDLRLTARDRLLDIAELAGEAIAELLRFAKRNEKVPMVGRTHMQPAMPSSVGLWASSYAEALLEDVELLQAVYGLVNRCPLGSAAGYGVPLPIDRQAVSDALGFERPLHNVIHAGSSRGKMEYSVLCVMNHLMLTLSRWAQDLILFTLPEFGYFRFPDDCCTGSSIMPQKKNPDVLEILRARAARVASDTQTVFEIQRALPSGYNRDVQETKEPFLRGLDVTEKSLRVSAVMMQGLEINRKALREAFDGSVFATDRAIELVAAGVPFRKAYDEVKASLEDLQTMDPDAALAAKTHLGATAGLDWDVYNTRIRSARSWSRGERRRLNRLFGRLLGLSYPSLD